MNGFRYSITGLLVVTLLIALLMTAYVWLNKEPRHIHTEFWTNMPPPSEEEINRELADSVGDWITLFDGSNLDQWTMGPDRSWVIEDGLITLKREFDGYLRDAIGNVTRAIRDPTEALRRSGGLTVRPSSLHSMETVEMPRRMRDS